MICKLCGSKDVYTAYDGYLRLGAPGSHTKDKAKVYGCLYCKCFWHNAVESKSLDYQTDEYRNHMGEDAVLSEFYRKHDRDSLRKLSYSGTEVYRNKIFIDVGCGGGGSQTL